MSRYASPVLHGKPLMMQLSPTEAAVILSRVKRLPGSRSLNEDNVQKFSRLMSAGEWVNDRRAHAVMINRGLYLLNGHHRLVALSKSDKPAVLPILSEVSITDLKQPNK